MKDIRNSPKYNQWKNEIKRRDGNACRRCGFENNLHVHHIKPFKKFPEFAVELDNGLTLCGNCHSLLKGKEESTDVLVFLGDDVNIGEQLKAIDGNFSNYLQRKLESKRQRTRDDAVSALFSHLKVYPNSLGEMLPLLIYIIDSENWDDQSHTKREAIKWLQKVSKQRETQTEGDLGNITIEQQAVLDDWDAVVIEVILDDLLSKKESSLFEALAEDEQALLDALRSAEGDRTHEQQALVNERLELENAETIEEFEAREVLDDLEMDVLEALKARTLQEEQDAETAAAIQTINRYEQRIEQQRIEQQHIAEQERLRRENERREAEERRLQEIISEYGSLEAYERHQRSEDIKEFFWRYGFFILGGLALLFIRPDIFLGLGILVIFIIVCLCILAILD